MKKAIYYLIILVVLVLGGCTSRDGTNVVKREGNSPYIQEAAMNIYAYQPVRALQIIDSAVNVGSLSQWRADMCRARIYSSTLMGSQVDSLLG